MIHLKIRCGHKILNPQSVAKILYNISTNNYGFVHVDNYTAIFYDNLRFNLLCYDVPDSLNEYPIFPITYSIEWLFIQKTLNQLDRTTKTNMMIILSGYPSKLLSIIDAILSFPINYDIICIIITNIFANIDKPTILYAYFNNEWILFCVEFGKTCNYLVNFTSHEHVIRRLINYFITIQTVKKNVNIMCTSESFTVLALYNESTHADFTMLAFDHNSGKISACLFDTISGKYCSTSAVSCSPFELKKIYNCFVIYDSNDNMQKLTSKRKTLLIDRIVKSFSEKIEKRTWYFGNTELFY